MELPPLPPPPAEVIVVILDPDIDESTPFEPCAFSFAEPAPPAPTVIV